MNDMTRQAFWRLSGWCVGVWLMAGCASVKQATPEPRPATPEGTNAAATAAARISSPPEGGYAWDELARLAAANSSEAKVLLLEAEAERHQTAVDTGWRNPQLRVGEHWGDEDETTVSKNSDRGWSEKDSDGYMTGLRVYTVNPFVNRWLRKRGAASVQAKDAEAEEVKYAVYCEVKSLCLEAEMLREDIGMLEQMAGLRKQMRTARTEQTDAGVASALELIRAETRLAMLDSEIHEKQTARQQIVRRIAVLAGVPAEQVRLRPPDFDRQVDSAYLDAAVLTDLAFLRRPDLQRALHQKDAAEHGLKAAQAGQIPWFEYVDGVYEGETAHTSSSEAAQKHQDMTEWQARVAVTLPVFSWLGDEVRLNRAQLAAAEERVQGLYDKIRREVDGVLEDYRIVRAERDRVAAENKRLRETMTARIDALADEATVRREDVFAAREELIGYMRVCMKAERECLRLTQYLETVSGGSLASAR